VLGDFAEVQAILKCTNSSVPIYSSQGALVNPGHPKTSADQILVQGSLESDAVVSISARKSKTEVDGVSFRWIISGTEGEAEVLVYQGHWQSSGLKRTLTVKIGNSKAQNVNFMANDEFEPKVPFPGTNVARQYHAFAKGNTETVATFQSALKIHRLLDRIIRSAGWESF
jgi:predicted dehydrogenase